MSTRYYAWQFILLLLSIISAVSCQRSILPADNLTDNRSQAELLAPPAENISAAFDNNLLPQYETDELLKNVTDNALQAQVPAVLSENISKEFDEKLIDQFETAGIHLEKYELGDRIVYFYQRKIGEAIVEFDYINYQFDKTTKQLLKKTIHWRTDLPESLPPLAITKEETASLVNGTFEFADLYFISPDSVVLPIKPTPTNPCWVVRSINNGNMTVIIIDATTGKVLGYGVPPP